MFNKITHIHTHIHYRSSNGSIHISNYEIVLLKQSKLTMIRLLDLAVNLQVYRRLCKRKPLRCYKQNSDCEKLYKTNNPVSSTNMQIRKGKGKRGREWESKREISINQSLKLENKSEILRQNFIS